MVGLTNYGFVLKTYYEVKPFKLAQAKDQNVLYALVLFSHIHSLSI